MSNELKTALKNNAAAKRGTPVVKIGSPQLNMDATIKVDMKELTHEIGQLAATMTQLAKQQEAILAAMREQIQVLGVLAQREVNVKAPEIKVPEVKIPARPSAFDVEFVRSGSETVGMRITQPKTN